jgi:hypothetical protein
MPCNGKGHSATCDCGWGGVWYGNAPYGGDARAFRCHEEPDSSSPRAVSFDKLVGVGRPRSLTIPNAKCPVCWCRVFFYQNEYGSRVFFDALGPPWPKHPCTDNSWYASPASGKIVAASLEEEPPRRKLAVEEWRQCVIYRKTGSRLILKELDVEKFFRLALSPGEIPSTVAFPVVFIREMSKRLLKLSYFHSGMRSEVIKYVEFERVVRRNDPSVKAREGNSLGTPELLAHLPFDPAFLTRVDELELSVRTANCLRNDNIVYIGDLVQKYEAEMLRTPNFGRKSLNEIKEVLVQIGLHLGLEVPGWPPENLEELAQAYATRACA